MVKEAGLAVVPVVLNTLELLVEEELVPVVDFEADIGGHSLEGVHDIEAHAVVHGGAQQSVAGPVNVVVDPPARLEDQPVPLEFAIAVLLSRSAFGDGLFAAFLDPMPVVGPFSSREVGHNVGVALGYAEVRSLDVDVTIDGDCIASFYFDVKVDDVRVISGSVSQSDVVLLRCPKQRKKLNRVRMRLNVA